MDRVEAKQILWVSPDTPDFQKLVGALASRGFEVIWVHDTEAAEVCLTHEAILVLCVIQNPALVQKVKAHFSHISIFVVTDSNALRVLEKITKEYVLYRHKKPVKLRQIKPLEYYIKNNNISIHLQPIMVFIDQKGHLGTLGFESLSRFRDRIRPEILFSYASKKNRLLELDGLCIEQAFKIGELLPPMTHLFVNMRPRSLANTQFIHMIFDILKRSQLNPHQVVFELTEQQTIFNFQSCEENLKQLRNRGFRFALDDFGAGFANLDWVGRLKPDYIKLSGTFTRNLVQDISKQVIVKNAVQLFQELQIPLIVENVENKKEYEALLNLGVFYAQGYYFQRPVSIEELYRRKWFHRYPVMMSNMVEAAGIEPASES